MAQAEKINTTLRLVKKSIGDMEGDLHDACNMAHIAADIVENTFADKSEHRQLTGRNNAYVINDDDLEAMLFAVYEVHKMLKSLRGDYLSALN